MEREAAKPDANLPLVHEELKKAFIKRGLYCGTEEQFKTYASGQGAAALGVVKGAGKLAKGLFAPTHSGSTGVYA